VGVLDHDDGGVDEHADRDRDPSERHDVRAQALLLHHHEGEEDREGDREDRDERRAEVEEEDDADEGDDDRLLDEGVGEGRDRALDEGGPVVGDLDLDVLGKALLQLGELLLDAGDGRERVGPEAHDHEPHALGEVAERPVDHRGDVALPLDGRPARLGGFLHPRRELAPLDRQVDAGADPEDVAAVVRRRLHIPAGSVRPPTAV
jgi:hypothetical protein